MWFLHNTNCICLSSSGRNIQYFICFSKFTNERGYISWELGDVSCAADSRNPNLKTQTRFSDRLFNDGRLAESGISRLWSAAGVALLWTVGDLESETGIKKKQKKNISLIPTGEENSATAFPQELLVELGWGTGAAEAARTLRPGRTATKSLSRTLALDFLSCCYKEVLAGAIFKKWSIREEKKNELIYEGKGAK